MVRQEENRKRKKPCEISSLCHKRHQTLHKKAEELEDIDAKVCIVSYDVDGNLGVWPEDERKARAIMMKFKEADAKASLSPMRRGTEVRISDMLGGKINKVEGKNKGKMKGKKKDFEGFDDRYEKGFEGFEDRGEKGLAMWDDEHLGQLGELQRDSWWCITRMIQSILLEGQAIQPYDFNNATATTPNFSVNSEPTGPKLPISGDNYYDENRIVSVDNVGFSSEVGSDGRGDVNNTYAYNPWGNYINLGDDFDYGDFSEMGEKINNINNDYQLDNYNPPLMDSLAQSSYFEAADNLAANLMGFERSAENNNIHVGSIINPPQTLISSWGKDLTHIHQPMIPKRQEAVSFSVWPQPLQSAQMSNIF
ncbi:hypothetical protein D8674_040557 [Pyrus ussuriensis x Pyrus communis]|uniref:MADS-box domain-containing protein n=1 Tax=Pyrus ussuriensis x Pyrus communis TaxID=2448454 RepID=A0A5N5FBP0_9ROSA|nr:hypothetical protein D8674_040557 [Pyrus ussuriensis x Pyrus communis]